VGDDAVGGFFAINGGALGADRGGIYYLAPDTLAWEALEMGHTAFMQWAFSSRLCDFYRDLRWEGWQADVAALDADSCMGFYPFLFTAQGSVHTSARRPTPVAEHYASCQGRTQACSSREAGSRAGLGSTLHRHGTTLRRRWSVTHSTTAKPCMRRRRTLSICRLARCGPG
jgi:hypothetical protein